MLFDTCIFKQRSYEEIMRKHNLASVAVHKANKRLEKLYSEGSSSEETRLTQETLEKNETYLKTLNFVAEIFKNHTGNHPKEASNDILKEIFNEVQTVYEDIVHELYISTKDNPVNFPTSIRIKKREAKVLGWVLGIDPSKTECDASYYHKTRVSNAINNLYQNARFYASEYDEDLIPELSDDFKLLTDFVYATFRSI